MLSRKRCLIETLMLMVSAALVSGQSTRITVGPNVQVSAAHAQENHGEVLVAADPNDANRLVGCSMISADPLTRRTFDGITYTSSDGGASWKPTLLVNNSPTGSGDPACGFGPDGSAYSVILQSAVKPEMDDVLVFRSKDGGLKWDSPAHIDWIDREYITVDTTGGKYNGRVYVNGTGSAALLDHKLADEDYDAAQIGISIQRSLDGGVTFHPPYKRYSASPHWVLGMGNGVVLSDGTYVAVFGEQKDRAKLAEKPPFTSANSWLKMVSSSDGGDTYSTAKLISDWYMDYGDIAGTSSIVPVVAADRTQGPFRDRLYVVWPDYRSGRGEIFLSYSSDKGKTWSKPHVVNDDYPWPAPEKGPDDVMPVIDVNKDGVVGVMWYDRRDNPHNYGWWVRFAASTDGGETFSPSVRVSSSPETIRFQDAMNLEGFSSGGGKPESRYKGGNLTASFGFGGFFGFNGGHTAGMAADAAGRFHPFWIDNRTGVEQIWSAAVSVQGTVALNGAPALADLVDVSDKVTIDFKNIKFDRVSGTITTDVYLANTSDVALKNPILLRVLTLDSKIGVPHIENASNHLSREGAVWDFSAEANRGSGLAPGQVAAPKQLAFRLTDQQWASDPPSVKDLQSFITFEAKALAPKPEDNKTVAKEATRSGGH